ncbi:hypothetical protein [Caulobacter phage Cr30]|uniref:hypothetical protein n=1 Tax=Caulobacter phage Cr30 TaxID=1357714 RepID=UPI0004A9B58A|nr:hypothetical protein OZ74_gp173 [Caulobacter phage Cr30]AGS81170.1 hypothetical protein [Caulobacter phage Cr30]
MTPQEIFDKSAAHLFTQDVQSVGPSCCSYRGPNNTSCAVGFFIPDEVYRNDMEGKDVYGLLDTYADIFPKFIIENIKLFAALQLVHDDNVSWRTTERMRNHLREVADKFNLNSSILETLSFKDR